VLRWDRAVIPGVCFHGRIIYPPGVYDN
jgi:hypothetical protein